MVTDGRAVLLATLTEAQFQRQVVEWAKRQHWRTYHTWDSRRSNAGFPDLVLVRPPRVIFAELKTTTGKLSQAQHDWLSDLLNVPGAEVHVWQPDMEAEVKAVLA